MEFKRPSILRNEKGELRKTGFEIEFSGIALEEAAKCIIKLYGGEEKRENFFNREIINTSLGKFSLQIDAQVLSNKKYEQLLVKTGLVSAEPEIEKLMEAVASIVVPYEISAPPVTYDDFPEIDKLRKALCECKAKGTKSSFLYAFATHINPELPAINVPTIINYLRAFFLLYPWIYEKSEIDFSRRVTNFINPFPEDYIRLILEKNYKPDFHDFANDYHAYNPDRNRPLDLYPLLAYMDKDKIKKWTDLGKVSARPTFHYRLPNSLIDNPEWSLASEWNCWVLVESLADNKEKIDTLTEEYLSMDNSSNGFKTKWISKTEAWVEC